jgi:RimJ/RimL family protein N-acetyltransferase
MSSPLGTVKIRRAKQDDCELILEWRNHPETRRYFFDSSPINPAEHRVWFSAIAADPSGFLLIGEDAVSESIGVVRFDQKGDYADVSIYLAPQRRGQGMGVPLLEASVRWLKENSTVKLVCADVLAENADSLKMFDAAGFAIDRYRLFLNIRS